MIAENVVMYSLAFYYLNYKSDSLETKHREMRGESKPLSNTKVPLNIQLGSLCFYIAYILLSDLMQGKL